jgi:hypothetical protein
VDADARDLPRRRFEPDAGQTLDPRRGDPKGADGPDQGFLEVTAVALDVPPVPVQIEDRVADELPGPVVRRLAAAIGLDDVDVGSGRHVQLVVSGPPAEGDHRRMLDQDHRVGDRALGNRAGQRALQLPRLAVRDRPEVEEVSGPH